MKNDIKIKSSIIKHNDKSTIADCLCEISEEMYNNELHALRPRPLQFLNTFIVSRMPEQPSDGTVRYMRSKYFLFAKAEGRYFCLGEISKDELYYSDDPIKLGEHISEIVKDRLYEK